MSGDWVPEVGDEVLVRENWWMGKHIPNNPADEFGDTGAEPERYEGKRAIVTEVHLDQQQPYVTVDFTAIDPDLKHSIHGYPWEGVCIDIYGLEDVFQPVTDEEIRQVFKLKETP